MEKSGLKIGFYGGVGSVTGANFMLFGDAPGDPKFLIDCGLIQGSRISEKGNWEEFGYDPSEVQALFITHAHLDHVGRIPRLFKKGFHGKIYSTPPTKEIAELILEDSLHIMEREAKEQKKENLFSKADLKQAMESWETVPYHKEFELSGMKINFKDAGHILGSTMVEFSRNGKTVVFTGDLGNSPAPLLRDTESIRGADYLVMESVYGDRNHEDRSMRKDKLENVIENTMRRGGNLVIPAFSIERTQELLYEIESLIEQSRIPIVPVFIDSPLAIKVTRVYKKYQNYFNKSVLGKESGGDGIFHFPQLQMTEKTEDSKAILGKDYRKIIMAGSGMSNGGRILHHEKNYLPSKKNTLLLVGYQAAGSLGRQLQDGAKLVRIMGQDVPVEAEVVNLRGYSAHRDSDGLLSFVREAEDTLQRVYVAMGEPKASLFLVQRIRDYLGVKAIAPAKGDIHQIDL